MPRGIAAALFSAGLAAAAWGAPLPPAPAASMPPWAAGALQPVGELERLEYLGRAQPDMATGQLLHFVDTLAADDPRVLEALMEVGSEFVNLSRADDVERTARRIEALAARTPLARPAAMLLRGQWLQLHDDVSKAERQFIEASALMPADPPPWLRLRFLAGYAGVTSRGGHYDQSMLRYDQALRLADRIGPTWRRVDLRGAISNMLAEAGQPEKAAEFNREQMQLASGIGDEFGLSKAYTTRAIQRGNAEGGADGADTLDDERAALEHARRSGNQRQVVVGIANIADYYLTHGDFQTAYDLSQRALPMARAIHSETAESVALANTGLALIGMHRKAEGLPLVHESMSLDERSGSARGIADSARELGGYLERAGYLGDAVAAYHQYRQLADELDQRDRQRALIQLQEGFANELRQHELDMLAREGRLKDEELLHHQLQVRQWTAAGVASLLLLVVVMLLARRLRMRNLQLSASNERLRQQAEIDPLTGLSNRHHVQAVMARRPGRGLTGTLYLLDADHFKQINDRCGHAGGDSVLVEIARRLRATLRDDDLVVRWGGEEFLVLVRPLPPAEAEALARRLLCALADVPAQHAGRPVPISASIGFAPFPMPTGTGQPDLDVPWERAIALVDTAMYLAKARGRNRACGIRGVRATTLDDLEDVVRSLEAAQADGRVELVSLPGPAMREAT